MTIRREYRQESLTDDWQGIRASMHKELRSGNIDRRNFLSGIAALLTLASTRPLAAADTEPGLQQFAYDDTRFSKDPWLTLALVQSQLFPASADSPGAKEINATAYLQAVLAEADMNPGSKQFILDGVGWLNDSAVQEHNATFAGLSGDLREQVLRRIEKSKAGERWIAMILLYTFEALLCDPVYGGNPGGIGWKWLEHQPGAPRPPAHWKYQQLSRL